MLNNPPQTANAAAMPSNSLAVTPPGSRAAAATEIPPRHGPLAFVAFVVGKPQTHEGFRWGHRGGHLVCVARARSRSFCVGAAFSKRSSKPFNLGAAVAAVHAQGHRQGPGQRVQFRSPLAVRAAGGTAQASDLHHGRSRPW